MTGKPAKARPGASRSRPAEGHVSNLGRTNSPTASSTAPSERACAISARGVVVRGPQFRARRKAAKPLSRMRSP